MQSKSSWGSVNSDQDKKQNFFSKEPPKGNYDPTNPGDVEENAQSLLVLDVYKFFSVLLIQSVLNMVPAEAE